MDLSLSLYIYIYICVYIYIYIHIYTYTQALCKRDRIARRTAAPAWTSLVCSIYSIVYS